MDNYSVLMSVYHGEKPKYLRQSIESIFAQTIPTNDFVLICDGPLTEELDLVIQEMYDAHPDVFRVIRLEVNQGLCNALNYGLVECRNELIARMDSDDVAFANRCELQLEKFQKIRIWPSWVALLMNLRELWIMWYLIKKCLVPTKRFCSMRKYAIPSIILL